LAIIAASRWKRPSAMKSITCSTAVVDSVEFLGGRALWRSEGAVQPRTSPGERGFAWGIVEGLSRSLRSLAAVETAGRNWTVPITCTLVPTSQV